MTTLPHETEDKIVMYSTSWCSDCQRAKYLLDEYGVDYVNVDVEADEVAAAFVRAVNHGARVVPTIIFPDGSMLVEPSNRALAEKVGLTL